MRKQQIKVGAFLLSMGLALTFACQNQEELASSSTTNNSRVAASLVDDNRVVFCHDGNLHDTDDLGALPMGIALMEAAGKMSKLVHVDYNNHIGCSNSGYASAMKKSVDISKSDLGAGSVLFYDYKSDAANADVNFKKAISETSITNKLTIIAAGPYHSIYQALSGSTSTQRKGITIISHDPWNSKHDCGKVDDDHPAGCKKTSKTWTDIKNDYSGITFKEVANGNTKLGNNLNPSSWSALTNASNWSATGKIAMKALYDRVTTNEHNGNGQSDVSDATMVYYYLHGVENASINNVVTKLKLKWGK
ncbi:MAG: hypothetical protein KA313_08355 [Pseudarcicella sp.]|nr:hypothetical protein [Pseudarcicella sp.]MBP6411094.1 hypothetical protein [Pseudarcicella sp.]